MKKIIIILSVLFVAFGCSQDKSAKLEKLKQEKLKIEQEIAALESQLDSTKVQSNGKAISVALKEIQPAEFNHYIEVQGKVDGEDNIGVSAKMMGVVTHVYVKEGDAVRKGQVLAELDAEVLKQSIAEIESTFTFVNDLYEKQKSLWEKKIGSEVQYLTAKNNKESLESKIKTLKEQLDLYRITSPIYGTVEEVGLKVGQAASPGLPAFRVVNFSSVKVVAEVSEVYSAKVAKGADALIEFPDLNYSTQSKVHFASRYINPINRTFTTEIHLNDKGFEYRANMIAVVKINDYKAKDAIVIEANAIQADQSGKFVFVAIEENNQWIARKQPIKEGNSYNGMVEIIEGLKINDKLIISGFEFLTDDASIKF